MTKKIDSKTLYLIRLRDRLHKYPDNIILNSHEKRIIINLINFKFSPFSFAPNHVESCINFVHHIEDHFREDRIRFPVGTYVACKICDKSLRQIHSEIKNEEEGYTQEELMKEVGK